MQEVSQALQDVKDLYQKVLGTPAPEIRPDAYISFPSGVDPVAHTIGEVQQLRQMTEQAAKAVCWTPFADTFLTDDAFVVHAEIPGVKREDLKVVVRGGECVLRGERKAPEKTEMKPLTFERSWGPFERRFVLPAGCYPDRVTAKFADGVLEVRVAMEAGSEPPPETEVRA